MEINVFIAVRAEHLLVSVCGAARFLISISHYGDGLSTLTGLKLALLLQSYDLNEYMSELKMNLT